MHSAKVWLVLLAPKGAPYVTKRHTSPALQVFHFHPAQPPSVTKFVLIHYLIIRAARTLSVKTNNGESFMEQISRIHPARLIDTIDIFLIYQ